MKEKIKIKHNEVNYIGFKFKVLTVISKCNKFDKHGRHFYNCVCDCGNEICAESRALNSKKTYKEYCSKNCKLKDSNLLKHSSIGGKFNNLFVLEVLIKLQGRNKKKIKYAKVKCDCGTIKFYKLCDLENNRIVHCGCLNSKIKKNNKYKNIAEIGSKKNKLTIINFSKSTGKYECKCDCENIVFINYSRFNNKCPKGCRKCSRNLFVENDLSKKRSDIIGKIFGKLKVLECDKNDNCKCICECGNFKKLKRHRLTGTDGTQSCGCIKKGVNKLYNNNIKRVFARYKKDTDLNIEEFTELILQNCYYCDCEPNQIHDGLAERIRSGLTSERHDNEKSKLYYNGLDRVDSSLPHTKANVVPCCGFCNYGKSDISQEYFLYKISCIYKEFVINNKQNINIMHYINECCNYNLVLQNKEETTLRTFFSNYSGKTKKRGDLMFEDFLKISKFNCFYCGIAPSNKAEYPRDRSKNFYYSGLDRVNSNLPHDLYNVVPCCYDCNRFKSDYTVSEFISHVTKIYNHLNLEQRESLCYQSQI
jgi:hypothetical protein